MKSVPRSRSGCTQIRGLEYISRTEGRSQRVQCNGTNTNKTGIHIEMIESKTGHLYGRSV